ncbi:MAG: 50S ribosome-binding GTPase [Aeromicrobium sp.]|uniref:GTPase family protein n=1 Tax=Aeromicrobium sp. TaxID=1871063 RepID=UPI002624B8EA|nr:GTPase [Aeromicrobium sp.]MDF1703778.1 50S ribosome-binding GTPase [Aeromicrobium sp.]
MSGLSDAPAPVYRDDIGEIGRKVDGLVAAADAAHGRLPQSVLASADQLSGRAVERLRLSGEHTIVALAGATGSGKSSLFNALTDLDLAGVGLRRPTTSWALACAWGPDGAQGLLEWMGIPPRHQVSRMSMLDRSSEDTKLDGLVLLDLPDHDSTEVSHHVEMDRLVQYADLIVWVLDPQKYADAAIHDRYLRPMAAYNDVSLVVLNQIDRIPYEQRGRAVEDVRRIVAAGGMTDVPVIGVSATRGDGIDDLRRELATRIRARASAKDRLDADIRAAAEQIAAVGGRSNVPGVTEADRDELDRALFDAVGGGQLAAAVGASSRRRAVRLTGWPLTRWIGGLRKDPLSELGIDVDHRELERSSLPDAIRPQRSAVETSVRVFVEKASVGLERPWRDSVRVAADSAVEGSQVADAVESAVASTRLSLRGAAWLHLVSALQWLLLATAVGGLGWWLLGRVGSWVGEGPVVSGFGPADGHPLSLVLGVVAAVAGVVIAVGARIASRFVARSQSARVERELRAALGQVSAELVVAPVDAELSAYERYRAGIVAALG